MATTVSRVYRQYASRHTCSGTQQGVYRQFILAECQAVKAGHILPDLQQYINRASRQYVSAEYTGTTAAAGSKCVSQDHKSRKATHLNVCAMYLNIVIEESQEKADWALWVT